MITCYVSVCGTKGKHHLAIETGEVLDEYQKMNEKEFCWKRLFESQVAGRDLTWQHASNYSEPESCLFSSHLGHKHINNARMYACSSPAKPKREACAVHVRRTYKSTHYNMSAERSAAATRGVAFFATSNTLHFSMNIRLHCTEEDPVKRLSFKD